VRPKVNRKFAYLICRT